MRLSRTLTLLSPLMFAGACHLVAGLNDYDKVGAAGAGGAGANSQGGGTSQGGGGNANGGSGGIGGGLELAFVEQFGSDAYDGEPELAALSNGKSSLVGTYGDSFSIGGGVTPVGCGGTRCMFIARHDGSGQTPLFLNPESGDLAAPHVAMNAQNIAVAGYFAGAMSGPINLAQDAGASEAGFVALLGADGSSATWQQRVGDTGSPIHLNDVALANDGRLYVGGDYQGTIGSLISAGSCDVTNNGGTLDLLTIAFNSTGACNWVLDVTEGPGTDASVVSMGLDGSDKVYVGGRMDGDVTFGTTLLSANNPNIFLARLDGASGVPEVARDFGGPGSDELVAMHVSGTGRVTVVGSFANAINFGGSAMPLVNVVGRSLFVASLDTNLDGDWAVAIEAPDNNTSIRDVTVAPDGTTIVVGGFEGTLNLGTGSVTSSGGVDAFIAGFDSNGNLVFATRGGGSGDDYITTAAVTSDHLMFAGEFFETFQMAGSPTLSNTGSLPDIFFGALKL